MSAWLIMALEIIVLSIVVLIAYNLLKTYVFSKFKISKWIIVAIAVVAFAGNLELTSYGIGGKYLSYIMSGVFVLLFLWLFDTIGVGPGRAKVSKTDKKISSQVIKPKAKPNRLKTSDMEVIEIKKKKKK